MRVYLTAFEEGDDAMKLVFAGHFAAGKRPARTCVGVTALAKGARIEVDRVARRWSDAAAVPVTGQ